MGFRAMMRSITCLFVSLFLSTLGFPQAAPVAVAAAAQTSDSGNSVGDNLPKGKGLFWVLPENGSWTRLVPLRVVINTHAGANFAGSMAESFFYKPHLTLDLPGARAIVRLPKGRARFYLRLYRGDMDEADLKMMDFDVAIVHVETKKDHRVVINQKFNSLNGHPSDRNVETVASNETDIAGGVWTEMSPDVALDAGEYALMLLPKDKRWLSDFVLDFGID